MFGKLLSKEQKRCHTYSSAYEQRLGHMGAAVTETVAQGQQHVHLVTGLDIGKRTGSFTYNLYQELYKIVLTVNGMD